MVCISLCSVYEYVKSDKSALLKYLETLQDTRFTEMELASTYVSIYDGGLVLHSVLSRTNYGASFASIARTVLITVCSGNTTEVHLCLDKYIENSIKDSERKLRGSEDMAYFITGPEQTIRQNGQKLLNNANLKNEMSKFFVNEWKKNHYYDIMAGKVVYVSYGGECYKYIPDGEHQNVTVTQPSVYQGDHEEADTLIAFHVANITGDVVVRASDTDVLAILIGSAGQRLPEDRVIMDYGTGNSRRYIDVTNIVQGLEHLKPGLSTAIPAYHAFTGCDFTSSFYRYV